MLNMERGHPLGSMNVLIVNFYASQSVHFQAILAL